MAKGFSSTVTEDARGSNTPHACRRWGREGKLARTLIFLPAKAPQRVFAPSFSRVLRLVATTEPSRDNSAVTHVHLSRRLLEQRKADKTTKYRGAAVEVKL